MSRRSEPSSHNYASSSRPTSSAVLGYPENYSFETKDNNQTMTIPNQVQFLKNELNRLKFEEDEKKKAFNESRIQLQDSWNKLVNLRSHIQRFHDEIEEIKIEIISHEAERSVWAGDMDLLHEGIADYTLKSIPRVAGLRNLREKLKFKESVASKIHILQERLQEKKTKLSILSRSLRESTHSLIESSSSRELVLPTSLVSNSMNTRTQLLDLANEIEDIELKIVRYSDSLKSLESDLNESVDEVIANELKPNSLAAVSNDSSHHHLLQDPNFRRQSSISRQNNSINSNKTTPGIEPTPFLDIVSGGSSSLHSGAGPPLSTDLMDALIKGELPTVSNPYLVTEEGREVLPEFTLDEVLSGSASRLYRMNGELPQIYLQRLEKRLLSLQALEVSAVRDFNEILSLVKRRREIVSFLLFSFF
jgi:predicted  nucleic acid-binding Zn-ribbon protein